MGSETEVDTNTLIEAMLSGQKGFASTKKLRKLGIADYKVLLQGQLAEDMLKSNDPRKRKRQDRKNEK